MTPASRQVALVARYIEAALYVVGDRAPARGWDHMGANLADAALQAGLRYETVVRPRVERLWCRYRFQPTISDLRMILGQTDAASLLGWQESRKVRTFLLLVDCLEGQGLDTVDDFRLWLETGEAPSVLIGIPGIGPKTADYLRLLVGLKSFPLDRHLWRFLKLAGVELEYHDAKATLFDACQFLHMDPRLAEAVIWEAMARAPFPASEAIHEHKRRELGGQTPARPEPSTLPEMEEGHAVSLAPIRALASPGRVRGHSVGLDNA